MIRFESGLPLVSGPDRRPTSRSMMSGLHTYRRTIQQRALWTRNDSVKRNLSYTVGRTG